MTGDEREREVRLRELLLRVVHEARVPDVGMPVDRGVHLGDVGGGLGDELRALVELAAVHGADRGGARANGTPRRDERDFAGRVLAFERVRASTPAAAIWPEWSNAGLSSTRTLRRGTSRGSAVERARRSMSPIPYDGYGACTCG